LNLVFLLAPFGQARALSDRRMLERDEAAWPRLEKDAMARRAPSMEIDSDIRAVQGVVERSVWSRWNDVVHRVGEAGKRREDGGSREDEAMVRVVVTERAKRGDSGQQIAEPKGAEGNDERSVSHGPAPER
jgi:hypothetical protein